MKKINSSNFLRQYQLIPCDPQVIPINAFGKKILYDANSMEMWEQKEEEKIELEGVEQVPFFPKNQFNAEKHLVFQATYACNLKCRYCFVENHYPDHTNTMSEQEHYDALQKFQPSGHYRFGWFGGEPLLNWETIFRVTEKVCEEAKQKNLPIPRPHITTNATLVTEEIADYCAMRNFSWIVSLDGDEETHNQNRPHQNGNGSFKETMRGLKFLADAYNKRKIPNPITLRATFDTINPQILKSAKFLNKLMYEGYAGHVSVEPSTLGEGCGIGTDERIEKLSFSEIRALFEPQYKDVASWFLEEIKAGRKPSFHQIEMPLQRFYDRDYSISECGAGVGYISIGPGGKICACHREHKTKIGSIQRGINPIEQAKWEDNRFYVRDICKTCWRRAACGGGCRCNSLLVLNHINQPAPVECLLRDMQFKTAIWILTQLQESEKQVYSKSRQQSMMPKQQPMIPNPIPKSMESREQVKKFDPQAGCEFECMSVCMYEEECNLREKSCTKEDCKCVQSQEK